MVLALNQLSDMLRVQDVTFELQRFEEASGLGSGQQWTAQLAPPKWSVSLNIIPNSPALARQVDAVFRSLGTNGAFLFADPSYDGPAADPGGAILGASTPTIHTISTDRTQLRITGLPSAYSLKRGDRLSVAWGTDRQWFAELTGDATASGGGLTALVGVYPYVPLGITVGAPVELRAPVINLKALQYMPSTFGLASIPTASSARLIQGR